MKQCIRVVFLTCMLVLLRYREGCSAVVMFWEGPNLLHTHFNVCGPNNGGISRWFWMWRRRTISLLWSRRTRLERAFQHLSISVLFLLRLWITRLRSQDDLWMRSAYQNRLLLCSFPPRCSLLLLLVSSLCCSWSAVKQTLRAQCRKTLQCHWMSLFLCLNAVYARGQHQGAMERLWRKHCNPQWWFCIALLFHESWRSHAKCFGFPFFVCVKKKKDILITTVLSTLPSWWPVGVECSGYACLSKSSVDLCFTPGGRVSLCRHVRVPPISDCALILYMNYSFVELD